MIERLAEADAGFDIDMPEVIGRQRDFVADDIAYLAHVFNQVVDANIGELDAGEGVHDIMPLQCAGRRRNRAPDTLQQADADIHLEEFEAVVHAALEALAHFPAIRDRVGIAIDQHFVAELAAGQLISWHTVCLSCQVE